MIDVILRPAARADAAEAYQWYESQSPGLGDRFLLDLAQSLALIEENPTMFAEHYREARRALLSGFPYQVFYRVYPDYALVAAIIHSSRDPQVWRARKDA